MGKCKIILLCSLAFMLNGCLSAVGNKIKIKKYPEIRNVSYLDMHHPYHNTKAQYYGFKIGFREIDDVKRRYKYLEKSPPTTGCLFDIQRVFIEKKKTDQDWLFKWLSTATFFIIPYYDPDYYVANAQLVDVQTGRVLQSYKAEEKVFQLGTPAFVLLLPQYIISRFYDVLGADHEATIDKATRKVDDSLLRLVSNDAYKFPECIK